MGSRANSTGVRWVLISLLSFIPISSEAAETLELPPMPPAIEELTGGNVKLGDVINRDNVGLIKDYLSLGVYENVKKGMVLKMGSNVPPDKLVPSTYLAATERNKGNAVLDDHGVIYDYQAGTFWQGGIPFTEPKTGNEVMANYRFGHAFDDGELIQPTYYVNKKGKRYKTGVMRICKAFVNGRINVPPLGSVPGMEGEQERLVAVFTYPLELKGTGQLQIKHVDDTANYDIGFAYLPAFKRIIRVSASTYQDNIGGSDFTFADPEGLREPFRDWTFKLIEKRYILVAEPIRKTRPIVDAGGTRVDSQVEWDVGEMYPRLGWTINPVYIVEATPKDSGHMYSKKVLYINAPYYASAYGEEVALMDIYDPNGALWKCYYDWRGDSLVHSSGKHYTGNIGLSMHDIQTGHGTHFIFGYEGIDVGLKPQSLTLQKLLGLGR